MYVVTGQISIDRERTTKYSEIFVSGGQFIGDRTGGFVNDSIIQFRCSDSTKKSIQIYLDVSRRTFLLKELKIDEDLVDSDFVHIGGLIIDCKNNKIISFIEPEDPCLQYKRGFNESFSIDYFDKQEVINTCQSLNKEFTKSFSTDYNINEKGDGIILDCRFYGNNIFVDGNIDAADGNTPKPNCN